MYKYKEKTDGCPGVVRDGKNGWKGVGDPGFQLWNQEVSGKGGPA